MTWQPKQLKRPLAHRHNEGVFSLWYTHSTMIIRALRRPTLRPKNSTASANV